MDNPEQRHAPIIPAISFRLTNLMIEDGFLKNVPTYANIVSDGTFSSIDGKLNGQPFRAAWPHAIYSGYPEQSIYLKLELPQQSIDFYERTSGNEGPAYAINYTNKEPEERNEERRKVINVHLHDHAPKGKYVFDTDPEIEIKDLEKLKAIAAYLKPTLRMWKKIGKVNTVKLMNSHGQGTLESLVVPESR